MDITMKDTEIWDPKVPQELRTVPGKLQEIVDYYLLHDNLQPDFAVATALVIGCWLASRKYRSSDNLYSNTYFMILGHTGAGKQTVHDVITDVMGATNNIDSIWTKAASAQGFFGILRTCPRPLILRDESGEMLKFIKGMGGAHAREAASLETEVWSKQDSICMRPHVKADTQEEKKALTKVRIPNHLVKTLPLREMVHQPAPTIVDTTTYSSFADAITSSDVRSGYLTRRLMIVGKTRPFKNRGENPRNVINQKRVLLADITEWFAMVKNTHNTQARDQTNARVDVVDIPVTPEFWEEYNRIGNAYHRLREYHRACLSRALENGIRIAIALAVSTGSYQLGAEETWALRYADLWSRNTLKIDFDGNDDIYGYRVKAIAAIIRYCQRYPDREFSAATIGRNVQAIRNFNLPDREDILADLMDEGALLPTDTTGPRQMYKYNPDYDGEL
jgi:energy-coupling factor transporter ATP-binding protein EcfA2